jgi:hypothetical protein
MILIFQTEIAIMNFYSSKNTFQIINMVLDIPYNFVLLSKVT